jgi:hypothetical protein
MKNRYLFALVSLLVACGTSQPPKPRYMSQAEHEQKLREHEAMIPVIEKECQKNRRNELTTGPGVPTSSAVDDDAPYTPCWKSADRRELDAHENAAAEHRSALRQQQAQAQALQTVRAQQVQQTARR